MRALRSGSGVSKGGSLGVALFAALALSSCRFPIDPDTARFACASSDDCGKGYECRAQATGDAGVCFVEGECVSEACNGADDDCDGLIDNGFDLTSDPAHCGACEQACGAGQTCVSGTCQ